MYINDIRHILLIQQSTQIAIYQIRSKSRMRSVHLLGLLVLLAVLSSSMANHKPDHDTVTTVTMVTIPDLRGKRLRRSPGPDIACGKCGKLPTYTHLTDRERYDAVCKNNRGALVKVAIGPVMPKSSPSAMLEFELCQEGKCVEATRLGLFGANQQLTSVISKKGYFIRETDVTDVLVAQGWSIEKPLKARMTSKTRKFFERFNFDVKKFPEPILLVETYSEWLIPGGCSENNGCKMTLHPDEDRSHYGDLLDKYYR